MFKSGDGGAFVCFARNDQVRVRAGCSSAYPYFDGGSRVGIHRSRTADRG